ncbi:hypothetical protein GcM1_02570 [Golovinomyces cichoracearum]|uniref:Uncharacterized protein n=1 Tax=Golovinomyces cichoracearum TaxID=62708 RepID=A0A420IL35_9PEZI|nr:hypothetical protein GcM1_02570 [Golovinomyces cichoracearum]
MTRSGVLSLSRPVLFCFFIFVVHLLDVAGYLVCICFYLFVVSLTIDRLLRVPSRPSDLERIALWSVILILKLTSQLHESGHLPASSICDQDEQIVDVERFIRIG